MFRFDLDTPELAEAYGRVSPLLFLSGKRLVQALNVAAGDHVLDVGCGTGLLADFVSRLVGAEGLVVGIDPLPRRIDIARQRTRPNLRFEVGTASDLTGFAAERFDAAYLHLVFHWLPDKIESLRQLHRVLKTDAPLGLTTSAGECENTLDIACATVFSRMPYARYPRDEEACRRVTSTELAELLRETGFDVFELDIEPTAADWPTADEAIAFSETISAGNLFSHLPDAHRHAARAELAATLEGFRCNGSIRIEGARIRAIASRR